MFFAGMNFMLHIQALRGKALSLFRNEEFRYYLGFVLCLIPIFTFMLWRAEASDAPLRHGAFHVLSILTTTGYCTTDFNLWPNVLRFGY